MSSDSVDGLKNSIESREITLAGRLDDKGHIGWLDGLRGFAALWVMIGHARTEALTSGLSGAVWPKLLGLINEGFGVPVFIVLSGFLLTSPLVDVPISKWKGPVAFMTRRAKRIYPAYLATILLVLTLVQLSPYWSSAATLRWKEAIPITGPCLAIHLLMIHNLFPTFVHKMDPPMWTLAVEWEIYLAFSFLLVPILLRKGLRFYVAAGFALAAIGLLNGAETGMLVICFVLGSIASYVVKSSKDKAEQFRNSRKIPAGAAVAIVAAVAVSYKHFHGLDISLLGLGTALLLVRICNPTVKDWFSTTARSVLGHPISKRLGWLSYSLYLVHFIVLSGLNAFAIKMEFSATHRTIAVLLIGPVLSIALAYLMAATIEYRMVIRATPSKA